MTPTELCHAINHGRGMRGFVGELFDVKNHWPRYGTRLRRRVGEWKFESGKSTLIEGVVELEDAGGVHEKQEGDGMIGDVECDDDNGREDAIEEYGNNRGDRVLRQDGSKQVGRSGWRRMIDAGG